MEAVREVTLWNFSGRQPNHVYLIDGTKALAYIPWGDGAPQYFARPFTLDRKGRKFEKLVSNPFKIQTKETRRQVQGSAGKIYWVDDQSRTCTCPGFVFRSFCKHL